MNRLFLCILVCVWTQYAQAQFSITLFDKTSTQPLAFAQVNYEWTDEKTSTKNIRLALANNRGEFEIEEASIKNLAVFTITHPYIGTQSLTTLYLLQNNYKLYLSSNTKPLDFSPIILHIEAATCFSTLMMTSLITLNLFELSLPLSDTRYC
jgi:hypothetical protein